MPKLFADEPFDVEITERSTVFDGKVWNVVSETFSYNGQATTREFVDHAGAVAVLAMDDEHRILAIQQYRHPIRSRDWEIPAGLLDIEGESLLTAARRELAEEVDLTAQTWHTLAHVATSPGGSNEFLRIYLARDLAPTAAPYEREAEEADIVRHWIALDDAVAAVLVGDVTNAAFSTAVLAAFASRAGGWASLRVAQ